MLLSASRALQYTSIRNYHHIAQAVLIDCSSAFVAGRKSNQSNRTHCTDMKDTTKILSDLRGLMKDVVTVNGPIAAYIIPSDDAHQSEYISARDERRRFVTGFDGSAGTAVVTATAALLWTDGRYYQQAVKQMDTNWTLMRVGLPNTPSIGVWLAKNLAPGAAVAVDPHIISCVLWNPMATALAENGNTLHPVEENLIDRIWSDQPAAVSNAVLQLSTSVTGRTIGDKVAEIRKEMVDKRADILVVTALDEVAWLLNLRGSDIDFNPVFFAYVIVPASGQLLFFVDHAKLPATIQHHFVDNQSDVQIVPYNQIVASLTELVSQTSAKVWIGLGSSYALTAIVPDNRRLQEISPIAAMKALKNPTEADGMRECHIRDGIALVQYFAWLERTVAAGEYVDEITGATRLEEFRKKQAKFMGLSFPTISASGPNASVIHYHPEESTNRRITANEMYLCDSGAQYLDGTTDVTRTWHFGTPTPFQIECNTRVLKGQMSLGAAVFPNKIKGQVLDTLARKALWDVGLDYGHGTGHGIGHFLNVHEGPMGISYKAMPDDPGLQENMFVSNEPGYYQDGEFGIRIEDIVQIVPATSVAHTFNGRGALKFRTVTMCPKQTKLIDVGLLSEQEKSNLNDYHANVLSTLSPLLMQIDDAVTLEWLRKETAAI